jgi:Flp pilus assembly protein TadD
LAAAAAEVEPWLPVVDPEMLLLLRAETKLANGENERALALLQSCNRRPGRMLRAKAMVANNELQPAQHLLEQLIAEQPEDPIAHFNLGLLAYEYLHDFSLARNKFSRVLELAEGGASIPLLQSTQCRLWLERMDPE